MTPAVTTGLWRLSALDIAAAIRLKHVSTREVIEAHLRRIEAIDPAVNAVPVVLAESALEAAYAADRAIAAGAQLGRLQGVPLVVKSNIDVAGTPTTQGVRMLAGAYPAMDAPAVERMKAAGAIVIGHSNMPNFAVRWHCVSELYGATLNPWEGDRTAGGSSAAVAVALATGMSSVGLGSDGLGSLRHPAQCCGITALKPTLGRIPDATSVPGSQPGGIGAQLVAVVGPLARHVADLRAEYEVISGPSWRDPWTVPAPLRGASGRKSLRVAAVLDPAGQGTAAQVKDGVRKAVSALQEAGYLVDEIEPPSIAVAARTCLDMLNTPEIRALWSATSDMMPSDTRDFLAQFYSVCGDPGPAGAMHAFVTRHSLLVAWGEFQETHPLIVAPVSTEIPFPAGSDLSRRRVAAELQSMRMVTAVNALGLPAVAVPVGIGDGLPQAVQVIGPRFGEDLCLDAAAAIEACTGVVTPIDPRGAADA